MTGLNNVPSSGSQSLFRVVSLLSGLESLMPPNSRNSVAIEYRINVCIEISISNITSPTSPNPSFTSGIPSNTVLENVTASAFTAAWRMLRPNHRRLTAIIDPNTSSAPL